MGKTAPRIGHALRRVGALAGVAQEDRFVGGFRHEKWDKLADGIAVTPAQWEISPEAGEFIVPPSTNMSPRAPSTFLR